MKALTIPAFLLAGYILFYILYIHGYLVINAKRALIYVGSDKGKKVKFSSCEGYVKRVVRFQESRTYFFECLFELKKGEVSVELLDDKKHEVLCLTREQNHANVQLDKNVRYYLIFRFKSASGDMALEWR